MQAKTSFVLLTIGVALLAVAASAQEEDRSHSGEPRNARCGPTAKYQHRTPRTPDEFERVVVQSNEVFAVRFHNDSDLGCRQMGSTWEKFALTFHQKLRLVTYYMDGGPVSEVMASYLRVKEEGYPNLKLYKKSSAANPLVAFEYGRTDGGDAEKVIERPKICREEPSVSTTLEELEQHAVEAEADSEDHPPVPPSGELSDEIEGEDTELVIDGEDEGADQFNIKILPPHKKKQVLEQKKRARENELHGLAKQVHRCRDGVSAEASAKPVPLLVGEGSSFSLLRQAVEALVDGLPKNGAGFYSKQA